MSNAQLHVEGFFDPATSTVSYLVLDPASRRCALIDSVLDYDPKSGRTATRSADKLIARVAELGAQVEWILETHVHADHLTAAPYLKDQVGGKIGIGGNITPSSRSSAPCSMPAATWRATAASSITCLRTMSSSPSARCNVARCTRQAIRRPA